MEHSGSKAAHAAFIIKTQMGITALGQDLFDGGSGGMIALVERKGGKWIYRYVLEMPSEAFGYAFAPDGTLLVKDPHGAVAITTKWEIVPLACD